MISNRQIAQAVHQAERALVIREFNADTRKDKDARKDKGTLLVAPPWDECSPEYQDLRTQAVHDYKMDNAVVDPLAVDGGVYAALVDALK